jgi:hypothetical protein
MHVAPKMRFWSLMLIAVCFLRPAPASASLVYDMVLLGEKLEAGDVRAIALGGSTQILMGDSLAVTQLNPALLSRLTQVTIGTTQFMAFDEGRSTQYSERDVSVKFSGLRLAFPIRRHVTLSVGYAGRYDPDGSFSERGVTAANQPFTQTFKRSGGLYSVPLSLSLDLTRYASVGLTYSIENGFVQDRYDVVFDDVAIAPGAGFKKEELGGHGFAAGLVLYPANRLALGGMFESAIDYDSSVRERFTEARFNSSYPSSVRLPARWNAGATWGVTRTTWVFASAARRDFSDFQGLAFPAAGLGREESYSLGLEFVKGIPFRGRRYPLRVSANYQKLPYDFPAGETLRKLLFGFGTGLLLGDGRGKIDIAIQAGKLGSISRNTLEDRVVRLYIGISGGEVWKRKAIQGY